MGPTTLSRRSHDTYRRLAIATVTLLLGALYLSAALGTLRNLASPPSSDATVHIEPPERVGRKQPPPREEGLDRDDDDDGSARRPQRRPAGPTPTEASVLESPAISTWSRPLRLNESSEGSTRLALQPELRHTQYAFSRPLRSKAMVLDKQLLTPPLVVLNDQLYVLLQVDAPSIREPFLWKVGPVVEKAWNGRSKSLKQGGVGRPARQRQVNAGHNVNDHDAANALDAVTLVFPSRIHHVAIEVGTNVDPETLTDFWFNDSVGFVWMEPQHTQLSHPMNQPEVRRDIGIASSRVMAFPAAVGLQSGASAMHASALHGCSSLLPLNDAALRDPSVMRQSFEGGDAAFPNWQHSRDAYINCLKPHPEHPTQTVPTVRGADVARLIPSSLRIVLLATDAQGYDLQVLASFGRELLRVDILQVECQDLPAGHAMFLTRGSYSCADIRSCVHAHLPHRMVDPTTGAESDRCAINNPSHERNCVFRRLERPFVRDEGVDPKGRGGQRQHMPQLWRRPLYRLSHPPRESLDCPSALAGDDAGPFI